MPEDPVPRVSPEEGTHVATEQERQEEGEAPPHPGLESFCREEEAKGERGAQCLRASPATLRWAWQTHTGRHAHTHMHEHTHA